MSYNDSFFGYVLGEEWVCYSVISGFIYLLFWSVGFVNLEVEELLSYV